MKTLREDAIIVCEFLITTLIKIQFASPAALPEIYKYLKEAGLDDEELAAALTFITAVRTQEPAIK